MIANTGTSVVETVARCAAICSFCAVGELIAAAAPLHEGSRFSPVSKAQEFKVISLLIITGCRRLKAAMIALTQLLLCL